MSVTNIEKTDHMEQASACFDTPLGRIRITESEKGITSLRFTEDAYDGDTAVAGRYLADAATQIREYLAGARKTFDVPLELRGSAFQRRVWSALLEIPYGETRSYQQIAAAVGNPKAARAVGMANRRNPVLILIPCHRVVGKNGMAVGYAAGIERKQYLLELETAQ